MDILEAIIGAMFGSIATTAIALSDNQRRQRVRIAREAEDAVSLARDIRFFFT